MTEEHAKRVAKLHSALLEVRYIIYYGERVKFSMKDMARATGIKYLRMWALFRRGEGRFSEEEFRRCYNAIDKHTRKHTKTSKEKDYE